ncbi:MAG: hypothetical protein AABX33_07675 [Nanoarchaeota archaeon]
MSNKKLLNNKTAKGFVSLVTIIIFLTSILATSIFYENNITANIIKKFAIENNEFFSDKNQITGQVAVLEKVSGF